MRCIVNYNLKYIYLALYRHPAYLMRKSNYLDSCKRLNNSWYSFKTDLTWTRKANETLNSLYDYNFVFLYYKLVFEHVWIEIQKETLVSLKGESIITSIFFSQQTVLLLLFVKQRSNIVICFPKKFESSQLNTEYQTFRYISITISLVMFGFALVKIKQIFWFDSKRVFTSEFL